MKTLAKITIFILLFTTTWMVPKEADAQYPAISFQVFYDQLSPYGMWVNDPYYGYVWLPNQGPDFYPYATDGHWAFTDFGWTWVSDYSWGWAPFHYGRWNYDSYYGWMWVPGPDWAPAWVAWRSCDGYFGWAPLASGVTIGMSYTKNFYMPEDRWVFIKSNDLDRHDLDRHYIGQRRNHDLMQNSSIIENKLTDNQRRRNYNAGPDVREVRTLTGHEIRQIPIADMNAPGKTITGNDRIEIYRPEVNRRDAGTSSPAPAKSVTREDFNNNTQRTQENQIRTDNSTTRENYSNPKPKYQRTQVTPDNSAGQHQRFSNPATGYQGNQSGQENSVSPRWNPASQPPSQPRTRENQVQKQIVAPAPGVNQPQQRSPNIHRSVQPSGTQPPAKQPKEASSNPGR